MSKAVSESELPAAHEGVLQTDVVLVLWQSSEEHQQWVTAQAVSVEAGPGRSEQVESAAL